MSTVIVYCHPYGKSFNHAILETVMGNLDAAHERYDLIDLHADDFVPFYDREELRLFHAGGAHDPLVTRYLGLLRQASSVIFITPLWWNSVPGMLKGFIDKVMKEGEGLSHTVTRTGIHGELTNIRHTYVLTTSTSPKIYLQLFAGNGIKHLFLNTTLRQLGMKGRHWLHFGGITGSTSQRRELHPLAIELPRFRFVLLTHWLCLQCAKEPNRPCLSARQPPLWANRQER